MVRSLRVCLAGLLVLLYGLAAAAQVGTFVQLTDTHIGKPAPYETPAEMEGHLRSLRQAIQEVNDVIRPDFVLVTGDCVSVSDGASEQLFADTMRTLQVPYYVIPGNHDDEDVRSGRFARVIGPTRVVIDQGPWHVVAFDGRPFMEPQQGEPAELLGWLEQQLSLPLPPGHVRVVASHYPLHINAWGPPERVRKDFQYTGGWAARLDLLFATHPVGAYLAGHTHGEYEAEDELSGVPCFVSGATCSGEYRICYADAGVFSSAQVRIGQWPKVAILQPRARYQGGSSYVGGKVLVRARVLSPETVSCVDLQAAGAGTCRMDAVGDGVWQAEWDTTQAANGRQQIRVVAHQANGGQGQAAIEVSVANNSPAMR